MSRFEITFDRIGRTHNPPVLVVEAENAAELVDEILNNVQPYLRSQDVDVVFDYFALPIMGGEVTIIVGFQTAGVGVVTQITPRSNY